MKELQPQNENERFLREENEALRDRMQAISQSIEKRCQRCPYHDIGCLKDCNLYPLHKIMEQ